MSVKYKPFEYKSGYKHIDEFERKKTANEWKFYFNRSDKIITKPSSSKY